MKVCAKCGRAAADEQAACKSCGSALLDLPPTAVEERSPEENRKRQIKDWVFIVIAVPLLILLLRYAIRFIFA